MDEETKKLLQETLDLNKENNQLLHKIVQYQQWSRWLNVTKWVVVVGVSLGALYYIEPMLTDLLGTYSDLLNNVSETSVRTLPGQ